MELLDRSIEFTSKRISLRLILWTFGVIFGLFTFFVLFVKSDVSAGSGGAVLLVLLVGFGIYLLPTIKAYQDKKRNKAAILVVNFFLGWTLVGWVVALAWALSKDSANPVSGTTPATVCVSCGKYSQSGLQFCPHCGKRMS